MKMKTVMAAGLVALLAVASVSQASLVVTNGDFEVGGGENIDNVTGWYDLNTGNFWEGAWQTDASWITPNGSNVSILSGLGNGYLYQSIGTVAGEADVWIQFDWGNPNDAAIGRVDSALVTLYANDVAFVGGDGVDVRTSGMAVIGSYQFDSTMVGPDTISTRYAMWDLTGFDGQELILSFDSAAEWGALDNISVVPEPATIGLVGLFGAGLLFVRRSKI